MASGYQWSLAGRDTSRKNLQHTDYFNRLATNVLSWHTPLPQKKIDGLNITDILEGKTDTVEDREGLVFYAGSELQAVRDGKWKIHFSHKYLVVNGETRTDGKPAGYGRLAPQSISNSGIEGIASRHGYVVRELPPITLRLSKDAEVSRTTLPQNTLR